MILRRYPGYKDDMIMLWDSLRKDGYRRSYTSLVRVVNKWIKPAVKEKQTKKPKPYKRAKYPGRKVQVDVKFVPSCLHSIVKVDGSIFLRKSPPLHLGMGNLE